MKGYQPTNVKTILSEKGSNIKDKEFYSTLLLQEKTSICACDSYSSVRKGNRNGIHNR